jgi:hypothetical protein
MSRRVPPLAKAASLIIALSASVAAAHADPADYKNGKRNWLETRYPAAYPPLLAYRGSPEGRTAEVDYMLGTSACRIDERRQWGARTLNYVLYSYQLTSISRGLITSERDKCRTPVKLAVLGAEARQGIEKLVAAGATARGKMFSFEGDKSITSYPARQIRVISPAVLQARLVPVGKADAMASTLKPLAATGRVAIIGRFAFVTAAGQSDEQLKTIARDLERYLDFLNREYQITPPSSYLTIYLEPTIHGVQMTADRVHGLDVSESALGYAYQDDLSTVAFVRGTQSGTLLHEMFHLLVRRSFGDIPQWLDEGIASLYEVSRYDGTRQIGLPNWRSRVLRNEYVDKVKLANVIASPWFGFDRTDATGTSMGFENSSERMAMNLATARYLALYLQENGKLADVYRAFRARDPGGADDPALEAKSIVAAQTTALDQLQVDYDKWLKTILDRDDTNRPDSIGKTLPEAPANTPQPNAPPPTAN